MPAIDKKPRRGLLADNQMRGRLGEDRIAELLDIAADTFIADGFAGASMAKIARSARASKTTFYARFTTKEKLFVAVLEHRMNKVFREVAAFLPKEAPMVETLREFGLKLLQVSIPRNISLLRVISVVAEQFPELTQRCYALGLQRGEAALAEYLASQVASGRLRNDEPFRMAEHFIGLLNSGPIMAFNLGLRPRLPPPNEQRKHVEAALAAFVRAYGTP